MDFDSSALRRVGSQLASPASQLLKFLAFAAFDTC
jgi:hypothetical protein